MKKNFGFSFWDEDGMLSDPYETDPAEKEIFYVHGFSMEYLNPEEGDIVLITSVMDNDWFMLGYWEDISCKIPDHSDSIKVISRKGKPFIWPKNEAMRDELLKGVL